MKLRPIVMISRLGIATLTLGLVACDTAPPASEREPQSRPAPQTQPETQPESQPATTAPTAPELPDYMALVARVDPAAAVDVRVRLDADRNRLEVDTDNVRRLRIARADVPLRRERSIVLRLDGQGIEWRADSDVVIFERSANGRWVPVEPADVDPDEQD
jgi:hypothetical protein